MIYGLVGIMLSYDALLYFDVDGYNYMPLTQSTVSIQNIKK